MYSQLRIDARESLVLAQPGIRALFPNGFPTLPITDRRAITAEIMGAMDPAGNLRRPLTQDEQLFIGMARLKVIYDAPFFLETFVWIDQEGHGLRPLYPLWESQRFVINRMAATEQRHHELGHPDGLLINVLKARQLGVSTLAEALVAHRVLSQPYIRAIAGSDVEEQARYLFRMVERIYAQLPWFLRPEKIVPYSAGKEIHFSNSSSLKAAWGKTTRGALQETGGKKGNIERGRTNSIVHISELATWDNPEQLDTALLPGVPTSPQSLVLFESTAELAGDWWHLHWQACQDGATPRDWVNLFIPWCVEPTKYSLPAPIDWSPTIDTLTVARQLELEMPTYTGEPISLNRDQLYWYETTKAYYAKKGRVYDFYKEYPSNPQECFQYAGKSVFSHEQVTAIDAASRKLLDVWAVEPAQELAELRRIKDGDAADKELLAKAAALHADRRPAAPISTRLSVREAESYPVPPGYGFRRLSPTELDGLTSLRGSVFAIWEYPRLRGKFRYVVSVDVGDGLGQDYSVITVVRIPTIDEPGEEVAQYVSNRIKPSQLAFVADAIGRLYPDDEGFEACMAVELNNHGATVQDLLQLHLGYSHFFIWEVVDAADPAARYTKRIGWTTTQRTRPLLLEKFHDAVTTIDPISKLPDFRLNSPTTRQELRFFVTEGLLGEGEHAKGQHDDCIFSSAIGYYVAHRLSGGESEPIAERRRRRAAAQALAIAQGSDHAIPDYRNTDADAALAKRAGDDIDDWFGPGGSSDELGGSSLYFDPGGL